MEDLILAGPVALPAVTMALTALSSLVAARAQHQAGQAQAKVAARNAAIARAQARDAQARGEARVADIRRSTERLLGTQRAIIGSSGFVADFGSALDIRADTIALGQANEAIARNSSAGEVWGQKVQAMNFETSGQFAKYEGAWGAGSTILGGAAQTINIWQHRPQ